MNADDTAVIADMGDGMSEMFWKLEGHDPVPCADVLEWGKFFAKPERVVAQETVGDVRISTVFLGIDHSFGDGPPLLFETMIFSGKHDQYTDRYSTWDEAEAGHARAVRMVRETP